MSYKKLNLPSSGYGNGALGFPVSVTSRIGYDPIIMGNFKTGFEWQHGTEPIICQKEKKNKQFESKQSRCFFFQ